ncbi:assimilatory sulfite reductase (NADPH) flavoprotein subunit [Hyphomonas jannaschiana]|uniref:Sulfite reductase [NADPH] flavoprotein alpha-component n=1 Tax=Hyphomonas jannaschiana VP2 TaxID=1280952 RepID=A0A059FIB3_9PROT|nr:sulfite reductase (NADPH) flavoprotein, alpha chain [Hyphomonas jannaschiana VP2]
MGLVINLDTEQQRLVEDLTRSLSRAQLQWLGGYFSGLAAGPDEVAVQAKGPSTRQRKLAILFGSETGNAAEVARSLEAKAQQAGLVPSVQDMADYKVRKIAEEQDILIIVSTHGEGEPPQPAMNFFEFLESRKAPTLGDTRFSVLALGDSTYEFYCQAGKQIDSRFAALGAKQILPRVDCDVDFEDDADNWIKSVLEQLSDGEAENSTGTNSVMPIGAPSPSRHDKRNPFAASVLENIRIVGGGSSKDTRHIELSLAGSGLVYAPGDALGIVAENAADTVEKLLEALSLDAETSITLKGHVFSLGEALTHRYEITTLTPRFLEYWTLLSDAADLKRLAKEDQSLERKAFLQNHHIIDLLRLFPVSGVMPQGFVSALRPLQPRLYSLASSLSYAPDEAHLTVAPVHYELHGDWRSGVASGLLAGRATPDSQIPVYVQENRHFRLPDDRTPIIMIGAGTGVAPYRAFLQEREARGSNGANWLFFGDRNFRTDFLYQTEWQAWLRDGTLGRMDVAFSRDQANRIYVQHRMMEQARDIYAWLEDGANIYVCGDAASLAPDVHQALIEIVAQESGLAHEAADEYVRTLQTEHRYQKDVY